VAPGEMNTAALRICTNCQHPNTRQARFCTACGWLMVPPPEAPAPGPAPGPGPFESGWRVLVESFPEDRVAEIMRFVDRQLATGSHKVHKGLSSILQGRPPPPPTPQPRPEPAPPPEAAPPPCQRCGAGNRPHSRFCSRCGAAMGRAPTPDLLITFDQASDRGRRRRNNEDRVAVWSGMVEGAPAWLLALADGMGGERAGEVASQMVVDAAYEQWQRVLAGQPLSGAEVQVLAEAIRDANRRVHAESRANPARRGMGSTATLALVRQGMAYLAHVGDSRAYLVDARGQVLQVTQDHSLVTVLVAIGQITPEEAHTHENRSMLYRSVGPEAAVEVDTFTRRLEPGDRLVLCSDGLAIYARDEDLAAAVARGQAPAQACRALIELANGRGGEDNVSVIVLAADEPRRLLPAVS
jgi:serine/threonine protein phosphatase PrpC